MRPLILIGGGGHCKSVIEAAISSGREILGVLDVTDSVGKKVLNYEIIGTDNNIIDFVDKADFVITVGQIKSPAIRIKLDHLIGISGGKMATIIASTANVSRWAKIGEGSVILHGAMVNADARIGRNCIINTLTNIEHDVEVGDFCHISTGAFVNGNVLVGERVFLGSQSVTKNGISIVSDCIISAGTFVSKDIQEAGVYAGNPVRMIKGL